ncbi:MAG: HEAT repeat domain-containing protein [Nitrospirae bacterium]|nr:HEAT repeat domain-containing protein [Nitrospirota bacterium]
MEQETAVEQKRTGFLGGVASTINFGGRMVVKTYDLASSVVGTAADVVGKGAGAVTSTAPCFFGKTKDLLTGGFRKIFGSNEKSELRSKISEYEEKIKNLYYEIGKEGSHAEKVESEKVLELIGKVRDFEQEIQRLNTQIAEMSELEALRREEAKQEKAKPAKKVKLSDEQAAAAVKAAIDKSIKHGEFDSESQREIFKKIASDLLDDEMEVKILAAAELGKMGVKPAVEILLEAVKFENVYLDAEIVNALTNIGDARAIGLCKDMAKSPNHRARVSSLRGLYKMGSDSEIAPYLLEALNDEHPEVRKNAATFLGWKDIADSLPGLVQTLQDKDESVRKAAVTALANIKDISSVLPLMRTLSDESIDIRRKAVEALKTITGEEINFDVELQGRSLTNAVNNLKDWWQSERISSIDVQIAPEPVAVSENTVVETVSETAAEVEAEVEDAEAETDDESASTETFREEELKRKLKGELITLCLNAGLECDETLTKAELIQMLLSKK